MLKAIPTPQDESLRIATAKAITATGNTTAFDLGAGYAPGGRGQPCTAVLDLTAADFTTGDESYSAVLQDSPDNSTWTSRGAVVTIPVAATGAFGVIGVDGLIVNRYVRVLLTLGGTTPSCTFDGWLNFHR